MHEPESPIESATPEVTVPDATVPAHRRYRLAIIVSLLFHLVLIVVLLFWYLPNSKDSVADHSPPLTPSTGGDAPPEESQPPLASTVPEPSPEIPPDQILASIESQFEQIKKVPDERKLSELEKNLKRLESLASEESVQEVTATIADSLGLDPGAVPKDDAPAGKFDTDTAQLHDVSRQKNEVGNWEYESVLVDAEGRTQTVSMTAAEGETIFKAFEQMKKYPMAAGIYRQVVMPMIQKTIQAAEIAEQAAKEAERIQREEARISPDAAEL